ncbi:trans-aconitate methyltransferase [Hamadaea flava]|uniref:Class I SAM-dependent methyltransferase n=1 Tax=Hamadaea flava TaxID=1742688 RepID=A0ABV8LJZ3_9ACTN|nr:class I SAM-dependent methyltransferase [Hamadaea flava]MCP2323584.1 trans-aconitate methyltransferase [Hamadaea flava]
MYDPDLAEIYDDLYQHGMGKDYGAEAGELAALLRAHHARIGDVLDVGCGTGLHLAAIRHQFPHVEGVEPAAAMRAAAQTRLPDVLIHDGDMTSFDLSRTFSAVLCLFSTIGYATTEDRLHTTVVRLAAHTEPGGVVVIEPWFTPEQWRDNRVSHTIAATDARTIIRMTRSTRDTEALSRMDMHYLVADHRTADPIRHFHDTHVMGLSTEEQYQQAMTAAGLTRITTFAGWQPGRPRLLGIRPQAESR